MYFGSYKDELIKYLKLYSEVFDDSFQYKHFIDYVESKDEKVSFLEHRDDPKFKEYVTKLAK
jgi:hypothetical protein